MAAYRPWFILGDNNGQIPLNRQLLGLREIQAEGKTLLDVGCAEGMMVLHFLEQGAKLGHGVEIRPRAVEVAQSIAGYISVSDRAKFWEGDLRKPDQALNQEGMLDQYDIVFAMASLQKTKSKSGEVLQKIADKCKETLVVRLPFREVDTGWRKKSDPVDLLAESGFELARESCGYPRGELPYPMEGGSWLAYFKRIGR